VRLHRPSPPSALSGGDQHPERWLLLVDLAPPYAVAVAASTTFCVRGGPFCANAVTSHSGG